MVVALGHGKFNGSSLPRPRFFVDVNLNDERVDPPVPFLDPLLSWANEAHWSMGGLSFQRHRLQGSIKGSIEKLRVQRDGSRRKKVAAKTSDSSMKFSSLKTLDSEPSESSEEIAPVTPSQPPSKKRERKLMDEFEKIADDEKDTVSAENEEAVVGVFSRTRLRQTPAGQKGRAGDCATVAVVRRISPRKLLA